MGSDFENLLNQYKSNYTQFLSTGNAAYKIAYQNAQEAIDKAILDRQKSVEEQKHDMKRFADSYQEGNSELSDVYDTAAGLFNNAQQIEDTYRAAKQRYDQVVVSPASIDVASGYAFLLRFGLILMLIPILFFIGYWSPTVKAAVSTAMSAVSASPSLVSPMSPPLVPMTR
jgi:hypothetical protein